MLKKIKNEVEGQQRQIQRVGGPFGSQFSHEYRRKPYSRSPLMGLEGLPHSRPVSRVSQDRVAFMC